MLFRIWFCTHFSAFWGHFKALFGGVRKLLRFVLVPAEAIRWRKGAVASPVAPLIELRSRDEEDEDDEDDEWEKDDEALVRSLDASDFPVSCEDIGMVRLLTILNSWWWLRAAGPPSCLTGSSCSSKTLPGPLLQLTIVVSETFFFPI